MSSVILLSEIHPDAQHAPSFNALRQAQQWHGLLPDQNWQEMGFVDAMIQLQAATQKQGKQLIVRDWSHVDYLGPPVTETPGFTPVLLDVLRSSFTLRRIQLVRHPLDTWLSLRNLNLVKKHRITIEQFLMAYRRYLTKTDSACRLVYGDFLQNPTAQLQRTCEAVGLEFDQGYEGRWFGFDKITGDKSNSTSLRKNPTIVLRPRRAFNDIDLPWLEELADYRYIMSNLYS